MTNKIPRSFFDRPTLEVCKNVVGQIICYDSPDGFMSAKITEVEAYIGQDDPACHAAKGKTKRNETMFGRPGIAYIYLIYGMYNCLNFVTEPDGMAAAVLLRGAEPIEGVELMRQRSNGKVKKQIWELLNGPGKFCRAFGLTKEQNGLDLTGEALYLQFSDQPEPVIKRSPRIGIRVGQEKMWRFYDANSKAVSKMPKEKMNKKQKVTKDV